MGKQLRLNHQLKLISTAAIKTSVVKAASNNLIMARCDGDRYLLNLQKFSFFQK